MKLILITLLLIFSGCSEKLVYLQTPCERIDTIKQPTPRKIRIYKDDEVIYKAYIGEFRGKIDNHNKLILKHNKRCDNDKSN